MEQNDKSKDFVKLSASQVTVGGLSVATLLILNTFFYSKEAGQSAAMRIEKNEASIRQLERTVNSGFEKLREDIKQDLNTLTLTIQNGAMDRWTRSEHDNFSIKLDTRLGRMEDRLLDLEKSSDKKRGRDE